MSKHPIKLMNFLLVFIGCGLVLLACPNSETQRESPDRVDAVTDPARQTVDVPRPIWAMSGHFLGADKLQLVVASCAGPRLVVDCLVGDLRLYEHTANGFEQRGETLALADDANWPLAADVDGDGRSELVVRRPLEVAFLKLDSVSLTEAAMTPIPFATSTYNVAVANVDADSADEIITLGADPKINDFVVGQGWTEYAIPWNDDVMPSMAAAGDLDGDGKAELIVAGDFIRVFNFANSEVVQLTEHMGLPGPLSASMTKIGERRFLTITFMSPIIDFSGELAVYELDDGGLLAQRADLGAPVNHPHSHTVVNFTHDSAWHIVFSGENDFQALFALPMYADGTVGDAMRLEQQGISSSISAHDMDADGELDTLVSCNPKEDTITIRRHALFD